MTSILIVVTAEPYWFDAVIVYPVGGCRAVGKPEIEQSVALRTNPVGNAGSARQLLIVPLKFGFTVAIAVLMVKTNGLPGYEKPDGGAA